MGTYFSNFPHPEKKLALALRSLTPDYGHSKKDDLFFLKKKVWGIGQMSRAKDKKMILNLLLTGWLFTFSFHSRTSFQTIEFFLAGRGFTLWVWIFGTYGSFGRLEWGGNNWQCDDVSCRQLYVVPTENKTCIGERLQKTKLTKPSPFQDFFFFFLRLCSRSRRSKIFKKNQ